MISSILWFRHGLRLHDNPALQRAIQDNRFSFYPIFIFDGESAGTKLVGYNRMRFLTECLTDLDNQLRDYGGRLWVFHGEPTFIFKRLKECLNIELITFEQDCEPIWKHRDDSVKELCEELHIKCEELVSHTLWDPNLVIKRNGGSPPLTYESFLYITSTLGNPPRPVDNVDWKKVTFGDIPNEIAQELHLFSKVPKPEQLGYYAEIPNGIPMMRWEGGERQALKNLQNRLDIEEIAFRDGYYLPNQANPDLLGPPTSQSAALRFGCLSVRKFYWSIHDLFKSVHGENLPSAHHITGQLIWREYFYTMSVNNIHYGEMERNPICLNIPWAKPNENMLAKWRQGKTGYPFIDAGMRQLMLEGWIHHVVRNAVACFLTRGDLWLSWEFGLNHFLKYLLDADWSVCSGNWMWISSSAFEQLLDCSECICPVAFGRRLDPEGEYIKRYIPELQNMPIIYLYEPWKAPIDVQEKANCIIGKDYPERMVDHMSASKINAAKMQMLRKMTMGSNQLTHCRPSNEQETKQFLCLPDECHLHCTEL